MYWKTIKGYNDLRVVHLDITNISFKENEDNAYDIILHEIKSRMNE